jgi:hypothetical protein
MTTLVPGTSPSEGGTAVLTNVVAVGVEIDIPEISTTSIKLISQLLGELIAGSGTGTGGTRQILIQ